METKKIRVGKECYIHPSEYLEDFIVGKYMSKLAKEIGYSERYIERVLEGSIEISPKLAKKLGGFLGFKPGLILRIQDEFNDKKKLSKNGVL